MLRLVAETGDPPDGCSVARVTIRIHHLWLETDVLGYRGRFCEAETLYAYYLESLAVRRVENPEGNRSSDTLLIAFNNANNPDKWRGDTTTVELSDEPRNFMQRRQADDEARRQLPKAGEGIEHRASDEPPPWEQE